ncbi:HAD-IA family hydrolase [Ancylobacter terrae]|uniref:HAD-IA family hydrolase n=1 Tax=Ancylobacter sp. sgz301288 TaxID=3342077 RepID=UPI00385BF601
MSATTFVIFDMDDVLVHYDPDLRRDAIGRLAGLDGVEVGRRIWDSGLEDAADAGALSADAYLRSVSETLGVPFGRDEWLRTRALAMRPNPDAITLADRVRARARVALLTNNGFVMREHFDELVPMLRPLFGPAMHTAAEFGTKKPDPDVYRRLLAVHGVMPAMALMIDDKPANVAGAIAAGLAAHHFTDASSLEAHLREIGLI